jgi:hypothetical protein
MYTSIRNCVLIARGSFALGIPTTPIIIHELRILADHTGCDNIVNWNLVNWNDDYSTESSSES